VSIAEIVGTMVVWFYLRYLNQQKELEKDTLEAYEKRLLSLDVIGELHPG
jgi:hypothetical protein